MLGMDVVFFPNCRKTYSGNFNATVEYLMNQVQHQQVNQQLNIPNVGSVAPGHLCTLNDQGKDLKMPLVNDSSEEWVHPEEQYLQAPHCG